MAPKYHGLLDWSQQTRQGGRRSYGDERFHFSLVVLDDESEQIPKQDSHSKIKRFSTHQTNPGKPAHELSPDSGIRTFLFFIYLILNILSSDDLKS